MKGTLVYAKLKKRAGFFNIFGSNKVIYKVYCVFFDCRGEFT